MTVTFKLEGLDKLLAKLKSLEDLKFLKAVILAAGRTVKAHIATYPPATEANSPRGPGQSWYQRGEGTHYQKVGGGESVYKTSETLGRSWTTTVKDNGLTVEVGAHASYAPFVQDKESQAWFHKARGWLTTDDVITEDGPKIVEQLREAIEDKLAADYRTGE